MQGAFVRMERGQAELAFPLALQLQVACYLHCRERDPPFLPPSPAGIRRLLPALHHAQQYCRAILQQHNEQRYGSMSMVPPC